MPLYPIVDAATLATLPEPLKAEYAPGEGGNFMLKIAENSLSKGFRLENTEALRRGIETERSARSTTEKEMKALQEQFAGIDPAVARTAQQKIEEMSKWTPSDKLEAEIEKRVGQVTKKHETEKTGITTKMGRYRSQVEKLLIDSVANIEFAKVGGNAQLLMPHVRSMTRVVENESDGSMKVEVINPDGSPRITLKQGSTAPMDLSELISTMREDPIFKVGFSAGVKGGAGTEGSDVQSGTIVGKEMYISEAEARDFGLYKARREQAEKAGVVLVIKR